MEVYEKLTKQISETKYLSAENSYRYRPIMRCFYYHYERLEYWLYKEDVYNELKENEIFNDYTIEECERDLETLTEWLSLSKMQDTKNASSIEEFKNKKFRYQLTEYATEIERLTISLEEMEIKTSSLEPKLFDRLRISISNLEEMSHLSDIRRRKKGEISLKTKILTNFNQKKVGITMYVVNKELSLEEYVKGLKKTELNKLYNHYKRIFSKKMMETNNKETIVISGIVYVFKHSMDKFTDKELDELATLQKVNKVDTLSSMFLENDFLFIKENEIIFPIEIQEVIEKTDLKGLSKNNKLNAIKFYIDINGVLSIDKLKELLEATDFSITTKELKEYLKELNLKVNKNEVYLNEFAFQMDKRYNLSKIKENFEDYAIYNLDNIKEIQETNEKNDYVLEMYKLLKSNIKDKNDCFNTANEILNYIKLGYNLEKNIQEKMDSKNLIGTKKEVKDFNHLLQEIYDNTPAWNLNGYNPKEKEINLSEEDVSQVLGYIKMYLIMNGVIKIDKLLELLIQEHHFDITKEDLIEISKISPDNHMISQYFCLAGIDKDILNGLLEQKSKFPKYKVINNLDNFFEEHDITETKLKKLINKYIDNQIVENQIISLIIMGGINEFTLNITLNANKIKLPENKQNRMLKDLENCQKNVRIWALNGYTMNEVLNKK